VFTLHRDENGAETDETDWCYICFHIFFAEVEIDTKIPKTKTDMDQNGADTGEKKMIIETKKCLKSCKETRATQVNQQTFCPTQSRLRSVMRSRGWVD
jgi:hypothetical protein